MAKAKKESLSVQEAAEAFILLHDSGNYSGRRYDRVLGLLRDSVKKDSGFGPIVPEERRPELDDEQQEAFEDIVFSAARVDDVIHPGGRLQKARESVDTILKQAEEGTLVQDGGRELARSAKERAAEAAEAAEDVQKVAIVPAPRSAPKPAAEEADDKNKDK